MLTSGFAEAGEGPRLEVQEYAEEGQYDYESDSDLDDFDDPNTPEDGESGAATCIASSSRRRGKSKAELESVPAGMDSDTEGGSGEKHHQIFVPNMAYRT